MPFIDTKTNVNITKAQETALKEKLGRAIECFPGKTETWLMLSFEDNARMWFKGTDGPAAMVEVELFGTADEKYYEKMTGTVCDIINGELGIPKDRIYVKYEEIDKWGWNGANF